MRAPRAPSDLMWDVSCSTAVGTVYSTDRDASDGLRLTWTAERGPDRDGQRARRRDFG